MKVLVTGGAGYIGSHTCVELLAQGHEVIIFDNFYNSSPDVIEKIKEISGKSVKLIEADMCDAAAVDKAFAENEIDCIIHFAGLKAVGESVAKPVFYYDTNIGGTINIVKAMQKYGVKKLVFSSSATVYGMNNVAPYNETMPTSATNPYGWTKLMIEQILTDTAKAQGDWHIALLRYFNPIGSHESGLIGEKPNGIPNNLMPYITQDAAGKLECLSVFGDDYDTHDGTGVRDYIHVCDLAIGHIKALDKLDEIDGTRAFNLGTGVGYSVLDIVKAFETANELKLNYKIVDRRPGDIATCFADTKRAEEELGFKTKLSLEQMCKSSWNFVKNLYN
ncbi:MAG: UDP-glucose 4-epimerase GalE [Acutalibacteraceae bacterium]|nr:UDP-glucose 4-epimerase GalE [Acutalibacteraceae bacterium]